MLPSLNKVLLLSLSLLILLWMDDYGGGVSSRVKALFQRNTF